MLHVMANKKETKDDKPEESTRKRVPITHRYNPDIIDCIELYASAQDAPPSELSVLESAAVAWLRARGFWPLSKATETHAAIIKEMD
jgi:hypothetical protein